MIQVKYFPEDGVVAAEVSNVHKMFVHSQVRHLGGLETCTKL